MTHLTLDNPGIRQVLITVSAVLLMITGALSSSYAQDFTFQFDAQAMVSGDTITIGNLASIEGGTADERKRLAAIVLSAAPQPGDTRRIDKNIVRLRLKQNDIDPNRCLISLNGSVQVMRSYQTLSRDRIATAVRQYVKRHMPWQPGQVTIKSIKVADRIRLPVGKLSIQVRAPRHAEWKGTFPLEANLVVDGRRFKKVWAQVSIRIQGQAIVTSKPLGRHQPITRNDVRIKPVDASQLPSNALVRLDQVLGRRTRSAIAAHMVLLADQVENRPVVKRGSPVQMVAESGDLRITTQGLAREQGAVGERIRVVNLASKKIIYARVIDAATVQVDF